MISLLYPLGMYMVLQGLKAIKLANFLSSTDLFTNTDQQAFLNTIFDLIKQKVRVQNKYSG